MTKQLARHCGAALLPFVLVACGGGASDSGAGSAASSPALPSNNPVTPPVLPLLLKGLVSDGPVAGAQVCLYSDGNQAKDSSGAAICSGPTDAQGNYSLKVPRDLPGGVLTLQASKDSSIKLVSAIGDLSTVIAVAGADGNVNTSNLAALTVSHLTTANFVLADTNNDGKLSASELATYVPNYAKVRPLAALIKAVIDGGQAAQLIGGATGDTLALVQAAARNQPLGAGKLQFSAWLADPANAKLMNEVDLQVSASLASAFVNYRWTSTVTAAQTPSPTVVSNKEVGVASLSCEINTNSESVTIQLAIDKSGGALILKHDGRQTIGSYDRQTGIISLVENDPPGVEMVSPAGVTFYSEGTFKLSGTVNPATFNITGSYSESTTNSWSIDATRKECSASGTFSAVKM